MKRTRSFRWTTIDQPGEFFRFKGDYLIEDCDGYENVWRVTGEDGQRVYVTLDHVTLDHVRLRY